jgi:purine-binding chemotaxis protein CheW
MNMNGNPADLSSCASKVSDFNRLLVVRAANHSYGLNVADVMEIMRSLPIEPMAGAPEMVLGLSVIRGMPVPVVALAALFKARDRPPTRFVVVRTGGKRVALAVDAVFGIHEFDPSLYHSMPQLLREAGTRVVDTIGALDSELLFVLNTARTIPEELLNFLPGREF